MIHLQRNEIPDIPESNKKRAPVRNVTIPHFLYTLQIFIRAFELP
jgi:hypothetical protein